ncbi:MAG: response regulator [Burkholderiaceae bacterium]|nr:response regulator [Burkholderiaceae bacterium]
MATLTRWQAPTITKRAAIKVLIAEDDANIVESLSFVLGQQGFAVSAALDGDEVLRRLQRDPPDVMVLDLMLPKRSGFEVLKAIKSDPALRDLPVMVLTAKASPTTGVWPRKSASRRS